MAAALMLYMIVLRLRADTTAQVNPAGGLLLADNPLGKMSHCLFLRLVRDLARATDVQLLFTTASKDVSALGEFPHMVKMFKGGARGKQVLIRVQSTCHHLGEVPEAS